MGFFSELFVHIAVLGLIEKALLFPGKLMEYKNDHSPDAPIIPRF